MIQSNTPLGTIATEYSGATRILRAHGIDFCCGGHRTLAQACGEHTDRVLSALQALPLNNDQENWKTRPIAELIQHILDNYHEKHRRDLPEVIQLANKVEQVHHDHPECPIGLAAKLQHMASSMAMHMGKEEQVLFPAILQSADPTWIGNPIRVMREEHEELGTDMKELHTLTHNFTLPDDACNTWKALYTNVHGLISDLMEHVSLENNVLFPRVQGE